MNVDIDASPNGLVSHRLLGTSVAIQGNTVLAGAPNSFYEGFADGAGFKSSFNNQIPLSSSTRQDAFNEESEI